ncbi:L(+)-tartrate dehydratase subunit beta [Campylobacter sp. faydin G-24]|uniref:L(+)-tartrate dehydratase subunit beta n=1 Tax=Campylobacter anatolicus TaxID=2829105 RepID=A0ABS5HHV4_9BACT|nr:L(+)-tartrate dehydratase subunit beta [Campylobacter anatolicus]MBR8461861.1 L(+)-tartrate dehydratase subunit beta [Campylobacter anatolicus]MBR8463595.1 L(+)-tartrate dehydratase subunit beta [Campylobacter anatolicus]MBR8465049.1 L(+)-tartrate dehydratase subunit beta [Campylobacter anatolicus]
MSKKILTTPIKAEDLKDIKIGDVIYLTGNIVTCRDVAHRRVVDEGRELPLDINGGAILHAGPIIRKNDDKQSYEIVSVGPTTSMRMEKFEYDFIAKTGVRLIVGKGGMKENTMKGCKEFGALHCVFPAGCAVIAATQVTQIVGAEWMELGMPETLWNCKVEEFGPLIVSIDANGNNLFETNKIEFNKRKDAATSEIIKQVGFIK